MCPVGWLLSPHWRALQERLHARLHQFLWRLSLSHEGFPFQWNLPVFPVAWHLSPHWRAVQQRLLTSVRQLLWRLRLRLMSENIC